jgi:outer membrane protein assembly factor BamA
MKSRIGLISLASIISLTFYVVANSEGIQQNNSRQQVPSCSQPESERNALIEEAEKGGYRARRVEFVGNENISDKVLRRRLLFTEGDLYTRKILGNSLKSLSKLKIIKPVSLENVIVSLERKDKIVDTIICVTDKRQKKIQS